MVSPGLTSPSNPVPRAITVQPTGAAGTCFYCGKRLSFLGRLGGGRRFCSVAHADLYQLELDRLAFQALNVDHGARLKPPAREPQRGNPRLRGPVRLGFILSPVSCAESLRVMLVDSPEPLGIDPEIVFPAGPDVGCCVAPLQFRSFTFRPKPRNVLVAVAHNVTTAIDFQAPTAQPLLSIHPSQPLPVPAEGLALSPEIRHAAASLRSPRDKAFRVPVGHLALPASIQPLGIDEADDAGDHATRTPLAPTLAAVGSPVTIDLPVSPAADRVNAGLRTLTLVAAPAAQSMFIPRLTMPTLRPRMAFGPLPNTSANRVTRSRRGTMFDGAKTVSFTASRPKQSRRVV